jgi:hypothetical protein
LLTSNAASLNPPADYLYGSPGHGIFLDALALCCASAFAQCNYLHPWHEYVMHSARASRNRVSPPPPRRETLRQPRPAVTGRNRAERRAKLKTINAGCPT